MFPALCALALVGCGSDDPSGGDGDGPTAGAGAASSNGNGNGNGAGAASGSGASGSGASGSGGSGSGAAGGTGQGGGTPGDCSGPRPGPDNTGVPPGTELEPSGSIQVTDDGAILENLDITGEVQVLADNVTIRKVRITSGDYYPIRYFDENNTGLVVEDSEIIGTNGDVTSAIAFRDYTARRLNIHGMADGLKADANVLIEDCWIHDLSNGEGEHNDAVQSTGGKGVTIRHNDLSGASNACVQTGDEGAATEDLVVQCNWLDGGGYALNIRGTGVTKPKNTQVIDNRFGHDSAYGPWTIDDENPTVTGNVYDDTDQPIPYP